MPGRPFRSRYGLSGPQPTHAANGKAKGSQWGTKRAKPGQRVGRMDAFPEDGGQKVASSSEIEEDEEEEEREKAPKKRRATSGAAKQERAKAATKRASYARIRGRSPERDAFDSDEVSSHSSDVEPDSDDPDRESSKLVRWREKQKQAKAKQDEAEGGGGATTANPDLEEIRRKRAEAFEKRAKEQQTIVVDGTDTEEEKEYQAKKREKESTRAEKGKGKEVSTEPKVTQKKPAKKKQKFDEGVRLGGPTKEDEMAQWEKELADLPPALRAKYLKQQAKKLGMSSTTTSSKEAVPKASTSRQTLDDSPEPQNRAYSCRKDQLFLDSSSSENVEDEGRPAPSKVRKNESRADRRRRTLGQKSQTFTQQVTIQTGASGSGSAVTFIIGGGGGGQQKKPKRDIFKKKRSKNARSPSPSSYNSDSDSSSAEAGEPLVPAFVDPRQEYQRRKARELSDPPTDAFSSSGGSEDEEEKKSRKKPLVGGRRKKGEDELLDEFEKLERVMKAKKRDYREKRGPGYSNPRKN